MLLAQALADARSSDRADHVGGLTSYGALSPSASSLESLFFTCAKRAHPAVDAFMIISGFGMHLSRASGERSPPVGTRARALFVASVALRLSPVYYLGLLLDVIVRSGQQQPDVMPLASSPPAGIAASVFFAQSLVPFVAAHQPNQPGTEPNLPDGTRGGFFIPFSINPALWCATPRHVRRDVRPSAPPPARIYPRRLDGWVAPGALLCGASCR